MLSEPPNDDILKRSFTPDCMLLTVPSKIKPVDVDDSNPVAVSETFHISER